MRGHSAAGGITRKMLIGLVLCGAAATPAARADDPNDKVMRSHAAREADRETIRQMNEDQLAMVRERDASYASGRRAYDEAYRRNGAPHEPVETGASYDGSDADARYAQARREYDNAMARWREDVAACRAGYYGYCAR